LKSAGPLQSPAAKTSSGNFRMRRKNRSERFY
jgi:hypothetical protein